MPEPILRQIRAYSGPSLASPGQATVLSVDWDDAAPPAPGVLTGYLTTLFAHPGLAKNPLQPGVLATIEQAVPERRRERAVTYLAIALQRALGHPVPWAGPEDGGLP